ncbi:hypothetical protein [Rubrivirga sp.]|uniref:hypothetical protein n=1 Tax=Rubrivirga sp. TaxID=1885344 RepID=UPI003C733F2E
MDHPVLTLALLVLLVPPSALGQPTSSDPPHPTFDDRVTVMAGLNQIALGGVNVAASVHRGRFVAEYSHGIALDFNTFDDALLIEADRDIGLDLDVPWTTGFGLGYRLTPRLDVRAEFKAHRHEASVEGAVAAEYTTFTAGAGVYYALPLGRGFRLEPSVRYWPTVATTLDDGVVQFEMTDGSVVVHEAYDIRPFVNVSVGYGF